MKTMKKLWISICSLAFAIAFGAGVATAVNVQPKQAEAESTLGTFDVGLSMTESELKNNGVLSQYNSRFLYLAYIYLSPVSEFCYLFGGKSSQSCWIATS